MLEKFSLRSELMKVGDGREPTGTDMALWVGSVGGPLGRGVGGSVLGVHWSERRNIMKHNAGCARRGIETAREEGGETPKKASSSPPGALIESSLPLASGTSRRR